MHLYSKHLLFSFNSCGNWGTQKYIAKTSLESWRLKLGLLNSSMSHYAVCLNRWLCPASSETPSCFEVHDLCRFWKAACQRKKKVHTWLRIEGQGREQIKRKLFFQLIQKKNRILNCYSLKNWILNWYALGTQMCLAIRHFL